ncbi:MAG: hypothetical protein J5966_05120 [Lachnospiraceae bacterium]|nr:hypothetical protein [Lachnospiraceae bacterium]
MELKNTQAACKWLKENTSLAADTDMLDFERLAFAVKMGLLLPVADTGAFVTKTFKNYFGEYEITEVYKMPDEVIEENLLIYPYRYKATLVKESDGFKNAGENLKALSRHIDSAITSIADYAVINKYLKGGSDAA